MNSMRNLVTLYRKKTGLCRRGSAGITAGRHCATSKSWSKRDSYQKKACEQKHFKQGEYTTMGPWAQPATCFIALAHRQQPDSLVISMDAFTTWFTVLTTRVKVSKGSLTKYKFIILPIRTKFRKITKSLRFIMRCLSLHPCHDSSFPPRRLDNLSEPRRTALL